MDKSPISLLQELMVKQGYVPNYSFMTEISNGTFSQFVCKVTCKNLSTDGLGINKKEAKQNAAQKMLSLLNKRYQISTLQKIEYKTTKEVNEFPKTIGYETYENFRNYVDMYSSFRMQSNSNLNYIGILQELCAQHKLSVLPLYKIVNDSGPSHMKIFTIECSVGFLYERGTAHCKKSAKQEAAKNLLQHLNSLNLLPAEYQKRLSVQSFAVKDCQRNIFETEVIDMDDSNKQMLENNLQKFGVPDDTINKSVSIGMLSKKIQPIYIESIFNDKDVQSLAVKNDHINIFSIGTINKNLCNKQVLENDLRKFGIGISDEMINKPISVKKLSKKTQPIYIESIFNNEDIPNLPIQDGHINIFSVETFNKDLSNKQILENNLLKFDIEISDDMINKPISIKELSKKPSSIHIESVLNDESIQNFAVKNGCVNVFLAETINKDLSNKQILENVLKYDTIIDDTISKSTLSVAKLAKTTQPVHIKSIFNNKHIPDLAMKNDHIEISPKEIVKDKTNKQTFEDYIQKLNVDILDLNISKTAPSIEQLSKRAQLLYTALSKSVGNNIEMQNVTVNDYHSLFKKIYFDRISDNLIERMKSIYELNNCKSHSIQEVSQDIQRALGVKLQQVMFTNYGTDLVVTCWRMLSTPIITQFGAGKTAYEADIQAKYEIINTVLDFLK